MFIFILTAVLPFIIGYLADLLIGDPQWRYHPIRLIGSMIAAFERSIRRRCDDSERSLKKGGAALVIAVCFCSAAAAAVAVCLAYAISPVVYIISESVIFYFMLSARSLCTESMKVCKELKKGDIEGARKAVSMIVGRDTAALDSAGIARAAVETVAENASDGVTAPMLYMLIGGAPLCVLYKAVNTMDSMVGYKNDRYLYFGRAAARLDDAANFLPARISAAFMIVAAYITGNDGRRAAEIYRRDRYKHASPNSAHTEAVCAGALGLRLAGDAYYFGRLYKKEYIGDDIRGIEPEDIVRANRLMLVMSTLCAAAAVILRGAAAAVIGGIL